MSHHPEPDVSELRERLHVAESLLEQFAESMREHVEWKCSCSDDDDHQLLTLWDNYCTDIPAHRQLDDLQALSERRTLRLLLNDLAVDANFTWSLDPDRNQPL